MTGPPPDGLGATPLVVELTARMEAEVERARRHDRPLSMLAVSIAAVAPEGPKARSSDMVAVSPEGDCFVMLLPETTGFQARILARRLAGPRSGDAPRVASFPDDAGSLSALLDRVAAAG